MEEQEVIKIILHEVAHHILKHKSALWDNLSDKVYQKQEKDADGFVKKIMEK